MECFYVYIILDPRFSGKYTYGDYVSFDFLPKYIGKGKGNRLNSHWKIYSRGGHLDNILLERTFAKIKEVGLEPIVIKFQFNMSSDAAYKLETFLIRLIGRKDLNIGPLCNFNDGGSGGMINPSQEFRESQRLKSKAIWNNKTKEEKELHSKKISIAQKGKPKGPLSTKHREKLSEVHKGQISTKKGKTFEEFYGVEKSKIIKDKISETLIKKQYKRKLSEETKRKMRKPKTLEHSESVSKATKLVWKNRTIEEKAEVGRKISEMKKLNNFKKKCLNSCNFIFLTTYYLATLIVNK